MVEAVNSITASTYSATTGKDIRYIGQYCYGFSGAFGAANTSQTMFDFTTGSGYIVATLTMTAPIRMTSGNITAGVTRGYQLDLNSQTVGLYKTESNEEDMPTVIEAQILIPPFTGVVLTCIDHTNDATYLGTANLTGRVYGAD